jgi:hypothetical protein
VQFLRLSLVRILFENFFRDGHKKGPTLGPTQPHIQRVPVALSAVLKWTGVEADHLPLFSAEAKSGSAIHRLSNVYLNGSMFV